MRKIVLLAFLMTGAFLSKAQLTKTPANNNSVNKTPGTLHCGTMDELEYNIKNNPLFKQKYEENLKRLREMAANGEQPTYNAQTQACQPLTDSVIIPVVVHVVGPAAMQALVTDAVIQSQIDVLNEDYQGRAGNFAKTPAHFQSIFGKSKFIFTLAKRNTLDEPFNGISRKTTTETYTRSTYENAKQTSTGGDDAQDPARFLNIWVVTFTDNLLGISVFPGDPRPINLHGFVCEYRAFGRGYSHLYSSYNGGRTTTHELGHYFNLYHTWGDDVAGAFGCATPACSSSDFRPNSFIVLPLGTDDTPNQCGATSSASNTTAIVTDACSPAAPGINYQNYMDYTNDAGLCMFTAGQLQRVLGCFNSQDRAPLLCSNGYIPPNAFANDVSIRQVVAPDSNSAYCGTVTPSVVVRNVGTSPISSFSLTTVLNGTTLSTQQFTIALLPFTETQVSLNAINGVIGSNQVSFYLSNLNGANADQFLTNDTIKTKYLIVSPTSGPIVEGFESTTFPPANWRVSNPDAGSLTWKRAANVAKTGIGSALMNFFLYDLVGQKDYLVAPPLITTGADSIFVSFARAYKTFSTNSADHDELSIVISTDCGQTFPITAWKKAGTELATVAGVTGNASWQPANASEWVNESINIKPFIGANTNITIAFATKNSYGQNLYLDDINIRNVFIPVRDVATDKIVAPFINLCSRNLTPSVQIKNYGKDNLKSAKVSYNINNGTTVTETWTGDLAYNQTAVYTFKNEITVPSTGTFKTWVSEPNALNDLNATNDTSSLSFKVIEPAATPLLQGFEDVAMPPTNWTLNASNTKYSWSRTTVAKKDGVASMVMRNRAFTTKGAIDELRTPGIVATGADSVFLKFDVSHAIAIYPGSDPLPKDTLEVLVSKDCGKTFSSIYKKTGLDLQTDFNGHKTTSADTVGFIPVNPQQWRTDSLNISSYVLNASSFIVVFRNISNNGNNTYIDNINVTSKIVPAKIKQNGYMIAPNPFTSSFNVVHNAKPGNLKSIQVYSTNGQLVFDRRYNLDATSFITIDMSQRSAGIYIVKLVYTDKVITERVVKTN